MFTQRKAMTNFKVLGWMVWSGSKKLSTAILAAIKKNYENLKKKASFYETVTS